MTKIDPSLVLGPDKTRNIITIRSVIVSQHEVISSQETGLDDIADQALAELQRDLLFSAEAPDTPSVYPLEIKVSDGAGLEDEPVSATWEGAPFEPRKGVAISLH